MVNIFEELRDRFVGWEKRNMRRFSVFPSDAFFKELAFKLLLRLSHEKYSIFNGIKSIDNETKEMIRARVRHRIIEVANSIVSNWMAILDALKKILKHFLLVSILACVVGPVVYWTILNTETFSFIEWGIYFVLHIFFFVVSVCLLFLPYYSRLHIRTTTWGLISDMLYLGVIIFISKVQVNLLLSSSISSGLISTLIITVPAFWIINVNLRPIVGEFENTDGASFDSVITFQLIKTLSLVEACKYKWSNISLKNNIMLEFERLAVISERRLLKELFPCDDVTSNWFVTTVKEIGSGFRNLKKLILIPNDDSHEFLVTRMKSNLLAAVDGSWDKFEKGVPGTVPIQQSERRKIKTIVGDIFSGLFPLALIWLLRYLGLVSNGVASDYLIVAAAGWITLSVLSIFNPAINEIKFETLKRIVSKVVP